ncbi:MAG: hypothetical protein CM15mP120_10480 [Pseudomonadota bacterium]|nr:MAG: hypothetical protein CM15mP120_10480 [Pseudomonadota bacterium]
MFKTGRWVSPAPQRQKIFFKLAQCLFVCRATQVIPLPPGPKFQRRPGWENPLEAFGVERSMYSRNFPYKNVVIIKCAGMRLNVFRWCSSRKNAALCGGPLPGPIAGRVFWGWAVFSFFKPHLYACQPPFYAVKKYRHRKKNIYFSRQTDRLINSGVAMEVIKKVVPNAEQIKGFLESGNDKPIYMLNLLKFKDKAEYAEGRAANSRAEA